MNELLCEECLCDKITKTNNKKNEPYYYCSKCKEYCYTITKWFYNNYVKN